ncbi:MAG: hypothetical protein OQK69_08735 [Gammaproteobacteria bacterium]|nr:hypothetical protein [Gammaproteobacteria bacterium]
MPATPEEFYDSAMEMSKGEREIDFRNAISRGYYAAYLDCRYFAGELIPSTGDRGSHKLYINYFLKYKGDDPEIEKIHLKIGLKLKQSRDLRVVADYYLDSTCTQSDANQVLRHTKNINDLLGEIEKKNNQVIN